VVKVGVLAFVALLAVAAPSFSANAQEKVQDSYPSKPVRIVVGFAPGGSVDLMARFYGKRLGDTEPYAAGGAGDDGGFCAIHDDLS